MNVNRIIIKSLWKTSTSLVNINIPTFTLSVIMFTDQNVTSYTGIYGNGVAKIAERASRTHVPHQAKFW